MPRKRNADSLPGDKLLALYRRLTLDGRKHFLSDLAKDLGCTEQTVTRKIGQLEPHLGKDVSIESGLEGRRRYYRLTSRSHEQAFGFSFEELHYLATCHDLATPFLPSETSTRIKHSLTNMALYLGEAPLSGSPITFRNKGYIDYLPHQDTIAALRQAIAKKQVCEVGYRPTGRKETSRYRFAPGHIVAMNGTLYAQGYRLAEGSLLKERPTTFAVHRITCVSPSGEYFRFDAGDDDARRFGLNWHEPKRVQVRVASQAADYVRDRTWSDDQVIQEHADGSLTLTVTTTSEKEFNAWVWSFGDQAQRVEELDPEGNHDV